MAKARQRHRVKYFCTSIVLGSTGSNQQKKVNKKVVVLYHSTTVERISSQEMIAYKNQKSNGSSKNIECESNTHDLKQQIRLLLQTICESNAKQPTFVRSETQKITKNKRGVSFLLEIHSFLSVDVAK